MTSPTRIAVAGADTIGRAHIAALGKSRSDVLSAIVDPSPAAAALAATLGVPPCAQRGPRLRGRGHRGDHATEAIARAAHGGGTVELPVH